MKKISSICFAVAALDAQALSTAPDIHADVRKIVADALKAIEKETPIAEEIPGQIKEGKSCEKRCQGQLIVLDENGHPKIANDVLKDDVEEKTELVVFVSTSMPKASLKALFLEAERMGARLVFRGLVNNSFQETLKIFEEIGVNGDIDPELFEKHEITSVPTITLTSAEKANHPLVDHVVGNVSLMTALELIRDKGACSELADKYLKRVRT